jgi:hypothetical protein
MALEEPNLDRNSKVGRFILLVFCDGNDDDDGGDDYSCDNVDYIQYVSLFSERTVYPYHAIYFHSYFHS